MEKYLVISFALGWDTILTEARRFTEDEKALYSEYYKENGFYGIGDSIHLKHVGLLDAPKRKCDGWFPGTNNTTYIISKEEWDAYVELNKSREIERKRREEAETRKDMLYILECAKRQEKVYTEAEAKQKRIAWNNVYNEGGEGYIPHYVTESEFEYAKRWLEEHPE